MAHYIIVFLLFSVHIARPERLHVRLQQKRSTQMRRAIVNV